MHIRSATKRDCAAVLACETRAFAPFAPTARPSPAKLSHDLMTQIVDGLIYVLCDDKRVQGFISMWPTAGHLFIDTLAVLPELHGQGLGSRLLAFAEREAARLRLSSVRLFTKAKMADNVGFYRRRGYCEVGRCDDDGFARVFYVKDVAAAADVASGKARAG